MRVPLVRRMLWHEPFKAAAAILAIAASASLLLFLNGVQQGVLESAGGYVEGAGADLWVARKGTENLIRSSSFLPMQLTIELEQDSLVARAAPVLRAFVRVSVRGAEVGLTLLGIGFDPTTGLGMPGNVAAGDRLPRPGEVVLDRGAAHRLRVRPGDTVLVNGAPLRVGGLSTATNLLGTQLLFARLEELNRLTGAGDQTSFALVSLRHAADTLRFAEAWTARRPDLAVFSRGTFARNSLEEVYAGFQPVVRSLALQGALVAVAVVALVLYGRVLERRAQLAVLLALGATPLFLHRAILGQALALAGQGLALGGACMLALRPALERWAPEVPFVAAPGPMALSAAVVLGAAVIGAVVPLVQVRRIEPTEVFRA